MLVKKLSKKFVQNCFFKNFLSSFCKNSCNKNIIKKNVLKNVKNLKNFQPNKLHKYCL